jgi:hypothetical protein
MENQPLGNTDWVTEIGQPDLLNNFTLECDEVMCPETAVYFLRQRCCGTIVLACDDHAQLLMKYAMKMHLQAEPVICQACHEVSAPLQFFETPRLIELDKPVST